jgi:hypothetical protein
MIGEQGGMVVSTGSRYRTATGAGTLVAVILVLAFGNPMFVDWAKGHANPNTAGGWFLQLLTWPAWRFDSDVPVRDLLAADLKAILVILFTAMFLTALTGSQLSRARGTLSQLLAGWAAFIFAGALAGLLAAFIQSNPSLLGALQAAGAGAIYGVFVGWLVGLATLGARRP